MARQLTLHPSASIRFTPHAAAICQTLNVLKRCNPDLTFAQMARKYWAVTGRWISQSSCQRYYYGAHHFNPGGGGGESYTQVRLGACVEI